MDSSLEINNKLPDSKEYVDQNTTVFERILSELESISKAAKEILSQNVFNNGLLHVFSLILGSVFFFSV